MLHAAPPCIVHMESDKSGASHHSPIAATGKLSKSLSPDFILILLDTIPD